MRLSQSPPLFQQSGALPDSASPPWRRGWDSNPRGLLRPAVFKTATINHSVTSPWRRMRDLNPRGRQPSLGFRNRPLTARAILQMAEGEGFEPPWALTQPSLSKRAPCLTRATLHGAADWTRTSTPLSENQDLNLAGLPKFPHSSKVPVRWVGTHLPARRDIRLSRIVSLGSTPGSLKAGKRKPPRASAGGGLCVQLLNPTRDPPPASASSGGTMTS